jgi:hypothetical protein
LLLSLTSFVAEKKHVAMQKLFEKIEKMEKCPRIEKGEQKLPA